MVIWINGVPGIGKSSISEEIMKRLNKENVVLLHSDEYFARMLKENVNLAFGTGAHPYDNKYFSCYFCKYIEKNLLQGKKVIVDMSLIDLECKKNIFDYIDKNYISISFILISSVDNLISRINKDNGREEKEEQITFAQNDMDFLTNNFKNSIFIDTDNKSIDEIAVEIIKIIKKQYINFK